MLTDPPITSLAKNHATQQLPDARQMRDHVLKALSRYWSVDSRPISRLPLNVLKPYPRIKLPLRLQSVLIPDWASNCSVDGCLLVPQESIPVHALNRSDTWLEVDWIFSAFLMLEGWHERLWESQHGTIHSYSVHLKGWDERVWQNAWVNRIGLFLREWVGHAYGNAALSQLGEIPSPVIYMTHDVDAIHKTLPIRIKQAAFNVFNAARALRQGQFSKVVRHSVHSIRFLLGREDWWFFDHILEIEKESSVKAIWHFYADPRSKTLKRWLMDPGYRVKNQILRTLFQRLRQQGHYIGLHPGFDTWDSASRLVGARHELEQSAGCAVTYCRQHWLRFSWADTWRAQVSAGITRDSTLMFNDRPGFRTSTALCWNPWGVSQGFEHYLEVLPTVIMDSHIYDYKQINSSQRKEEICHWISECNRVGGEIAVLWHPHTLSQDYGWSAGFYQLIDSIRGLQI